MTTPRKHCIIGIPDHQGVIHVGGRIGAAKGPDAFRRCFAKLKGEMGPSSSLAQDLGDVPELSQDVSTNHLRASEWIEKIHRTHSTSIVVGGGHDHGFTHLNGIWRALKKPKGAAPRLGCINIDAHLDVRKPNPLITSGSPFYLALEAGILNPKRFIEFGIQSHCNAPDLWSYIEKKGVKVVPFQTLRHHAVSQFKTHLKKLASICDQVVISLDLDAASAAYSPGVSAPQAEGFTASEIIEMMEIAGKMKKVVSLGIFELNPDYDRDDQSARLAATAAFHFLATKSGF